MTDHEAPRRGASASRPRPSRAAGGQGWTRTSQHLLGILLLFGTERSGFFVRQQVGETDDAIERSAQFV